MMRASTLAIFLLAACAPAAYREPANVDTATLRIENQGPALFGYELEADTYEDAAACGGRLRVASAKALPRGVAHTVRVAAGTDFTLTIRAAGGGPSRGDSCALAGTFAPTAGEHYAAIFRADERKCELLLLRQQTVATGARRYVREVSYRERYDAACLGASAPSSIPAPAGVPQLPPGSGAPPVPPLPPR